jgi:hypothetical protein
MLRYSKWSSDIFPKGFSTKFWYAFPSCSPYHNIQVLKLHLYWKKVNIFTKQESNEGRLGTCLTLGGNWAAPHQNLTSCITLTVALGMKCCCRNLPAYLTDLALEVWPLGKSHIVSQKEAVIVCLTRYLRQPSTNSWQWEPQDDISFYVLNQTPHHEDLAGSESVASCILNFSSRWWWMISFSPPLLHP